MKQRVIYSLEILVSLLVVGSLLWVAFYVKPHTEVAGVEPALFGYRNNFYGVVVPDQDGRVVWAVGTGGRIIRSENAGETWTLQKTPAHNNLQDIAVWDDAAALVVGDEGTVLVTQDGGQTWINVEVPLREFGEQLLQAHVEKSTDRAWIAGTFGTLFRSLDRGVSWEMVHPEIDVAWNDVTVAPDGTVWIVGEFGSVRRSTDGGETWEDVAVDTEISLMSIAFADASNAVVVGLSGTIAQSTDGGQTWQIVPTEHENHLYTVTWTGTNFAVVGDAGMAGRAGRSGTDWKFFRLAENNFGWYTGSAASGPETLYASGANLGVLEGDTWRQFQGQNQK
jgi:photosystem II stability/assembly factor-like uncharacterized protein